MGEEPLEHTCWIPIPPKPKARPRMTRRGRVFTPKATVDYEEAVAEHWDGPVFDGPVAVTLAYKKAGTEVTVTELEPAKTASRADLDNLVKASLDGLQRQGGAFVNDSQVRVLHAWKST